MSEVAQSSRTGGGTSSAGGVARWDDIRKRLGPVFMVVILILAGYLLYRTLRGYSFGDIVSSVTAIPLWRLGMAGLFAAGSYFCLSWSDYLATRYVGHDFPYPRVALTSFLGLSIGHNLGFAALSSGAIRYRFYTRWGMSTGEVAKVIVFCGLTVIVGLVALGGMAFLFEAELTQEVTHLGDHWTIGLGIACFASVAIYLVLCAFVRHQVSIFGWTLEFPGIRLAVAQLVVGAVNFALVGACLHQTLKAVADVPYVTAAVAFVIANLGVLVSHIPGGLGVIEAVVSTLIPKSGVIGALLVFRFVYFLVPLAIGGTIFLVTEVAIRGRSREKS